MDQNKPDYQSYLLRMWLTQEEDGAQWRASLEEVQSGKLRGFSKMADLFDYLKAVTTPEEPEPEVRVEGLIPDS